MRRAAILAVLLAAAPAALATQALGDDESHTYEIELDSAFGLVPGSDVRIAGVNAGTVEDLSLNAEKRAVVEIELSGPLSVLGEETTCTTEPQSLIAEYFIDCAPAGAPLADGGLIPVEQTSQTVQPDIFQNTMRLPFRERLTLLVNEFGTGLAGNGANLNAAIERGAPTLRSLQKAIDILADQNQRLRGLAANGDRVLTALEERSGDVTKFVEEAGETASASAERRDDLAADFDRLDDFLASVRPTIVELGNVAEENVPLLTDLREAAPHLNTLATIFPAFAANGAVSIEGLGEASVTGIEALQDAEPVIDQLAESGKGTPQLAELASDFLRDLTDPGRIVEYDGRAERKCDDPTLPCWSTGREGPTGYTAVEGLLNYAYYLTNGTSQFDQVGHLLHFSVFDFGEGPCGVFDSGREEDGSAGVPAKDGGLTTDILETHPCVSWLGPNQPGINEDLDLPRYDDSVCPNGTAPEAALELCDPDISTDGPDGQEPASAPEGEEGEDEVSAEPGPATQPGPVPPAGGPLGELGDLLDLGDLLEEPSAGLGLGGPTGPGSGNGNAGSQELLDFLFGG